MNTTATIERKARKSAEERKHTYYLRLAILLRQGRLHRMPEGIKRASFEVPGIGHVDLYASSTYTGYGYMVTYGAQGYECGCEHYEHKRTCSHCQDANARAKARHQRARELAEAATIASSVLAEMVASDDLSAHVEDSIESGECAEAHSDISAQLDAINEWVAREDAVWASMSYAERQAKLNGVQPTEDADPWADPEYNPFAGMTEDEKRAARYWMFENVA